MLPCGPLVLSITRRNKGILSPLFCSPSKSIMKWNHVRTMMILAPTNFDHLGHGNVMLTKLNSYAWWAIIKQLLRKVTFCSPPHAMDDGSSSSFEIQIESISMVHVLLYPIRDLIYYWRDQSTTTLSKNKKKKKQSNSTTTTTISISYKI